MNLRLRLRCVRCYRFTHWINLVVCLLDYEWCTGDMNLSLRCVRWYYALNKPCDVFVGLWMMYGRDKSAPTVCSLYTFMQWINLVVCLLDYEWLSGAMNLRLRLRCVCWYYALNKPCGVFVGLWNDVRARWICPYAYGVFADIHLRNE